MTRNDRDEERDERINNEVIVDAYTQYLTKHPRLAVSEA